jgi:hypothetical protein
MMTQSTLKPKPTTEPHSTCSGCAYFSDFSDSRGQGWCRVFNQSAKRHHQRTSDCDSSILTLEKENQPATLIKVQLTTEAVEDDGYGYAVPVDHLIIDVFVTHPSRELVKAAIAERKDLQGYRIDDFWIPEDYSEF